MAQNSNFYIIFLHLFQELETEDPTEVPCTYSKRGTLSLTQRLKELDRLVLANREEELACSLKLNSLLDIIED